VSPRTAKAKNGHFVAPLYLATAGGKRIDVC
jgi:hypothetical protein